MRLPSPLARFAALLTLLAATSCRRTPALKPDTDFYRRVQADLIRARPGDVVELPEGKFVLDRSLTSVASDITIRGKGMDKKHGA